MTPTPWPAFAGIDWGGENHQLCVVDPAGKRLTQLRVAHDVAGLCDLLRELARFGHQVPIAIERAEGLLVEYLRAHGHVLFPVSPRTPPALASGTRSPRSRTIGYSRSSWPTHCVTSISTGGR